MLRRIEARLRRQLGLPTPRERRVFLGRELVVREGTLASTPDYDDAWLFACAEHSHHVLDVGANMGQSALLVLSAPTVEQVVLVEANRDALSIAADNLIQNGLSARARFVSAFASDTADEVVELWTVGTGAAGSMYQGHAVSAAQAGTRQSVSTITLDDLCRKLGFEPDLVKIDVEGAEAKVLAGASKVARAQKARFLVEMHSPPELPMERNARAVLDWAASLGHSAWYMSEGTQLTDPSTIQRRGRCHLLLQPASWPYPEWLRGIPQSAPLPSR